MGIRVTVWNEYLHELQFPEVAAVYPEGIHGCIAGFLKEAGMDVKTATLEQPEHGFPCGVIRYVMEIVEAVIQIKTAFLETAGTFHQLQRCIHAASDKDGLDRGIRLVTGGGMSF